jgi:hypothetical protein
MSSTNEDWVGLGLNFVGNGQSIQFTLGPYSFRTELVNMTLAAKSAVFPIVFTAESDNPEPLYETQTFTSNSTLMVYSEALPEFEWYHVPALVALAGLLYVLL